MVRKINNKGITVIEIIIVAAIVAVILGISIPYYTKWKKRSSIESDTKKIYSILQMYRMKAFSEKKSFTVKINNNLLNIYQGDTQVYSLKLENPFSFIGSYNQLSIDQRGTFHGSSIYALDTEDINPQYDCIAIDDIRVRLGKYNKEEGKCVAK